MYFAYTTWIYLHHGLQGSFLPGYVPAADGVESEEGIPKLYGKERSELLVSQWSQSYSEIHIDQLLLL